jgi:hypothetical protein
MDLSIEEVKPIVEKKKRGRKPKPKPINTEVSTLPKKRGRKPKGGKIIDKTDANMETNSYIQENVILHLKCGENDIVSNTYEMDNLEYFIEDLKCEEIKSDEPENSEFTEHVVSNEDVSNKVEDIDNKIINKKIVELQKQLFYHECSDKKSACFWCTYDFDHPTIHIPKYKLNDSYHVYGCFCSPECAVSFLMKEVIDTTQKYERYQLLNYIYGNVFNNSHDLKPAPNPFYTLDKYFGNMSIKEYRQLLKYNRLLLVVDKPLTRVLPEIYEENDLQFSFNQSQTSFQIKKQEKGINKKTYLSDSFFNFT